MTFQNHLVHCTQIAMTDICRICNTRMGNSAAKIMNHLQSVHDLNLSPGSFRLIANNILYSPLSCNDGWSVLRDLWNWDCLRCPTLSLEKDKLVKKIAAKDEEIQNLNTKLNDLKQEMENYTKPSHPYNSNKEIGDGNDGNEEVFLATPREESKIMNMNSDEEYADQESTEKVKAESNSDIFINENNIQTEISSETEVVHCKVAPHLPEIIRQRKCSETQPLRCPHCPANLFQSQADRAHHFTTYSHKINAKQLPGVYDYFAKALSNEMETDLR